MFFGPALQTAPAGLRPGKKGCRFPRDGRCIEEIGTYDPKNEANAITIDADKAKQWIKNGAQPSDTVRGLLKKANVL